MEEIMSYNLQRRKFLLLGAKSLLGLSTITPAVSFLIGCDRKTRKNFLRLQSPWINDAEFIGYFIAIEKGYYKDEGIDFKYLQGGPEIIADSVLMAEHSEIALTTPDVTINAILKQKAPFKIIGTQYQKNPLGIISLKESNINSPQDLIGKTLAAPPANHLTVDAFLKINGIDKMEVKIVPYQYDPSPLINGEVDATLDFVTNVPFTIKERGKNPSSFLLYDYGFKIFNDTIVVREDTLENQKELLTRWIRASKRGWEDNFLNPEKFPVEFSQTYYKGTGRSTENEIYFNRAQRSLIETENGIFSMTESAIEDNIKSLQAVGINATRAMFVNDLVQ